MPSASPARYSRLQIGLHWLIFLLFGFNYIVSDGMGRALHIRLDGGVAEGFVPLVHPPVGIAVLVLTLIRLIARAITAAPEPAASNHPLMDRAAQWTHWALYALLILLPAGGIAAWQFGIEAAGDVHAALANITLALIGLHAAAALFHQFVLKDNLLARMKPGT